MKKKTKAKAVKAVKKDIKKSKEKIVKKIKGREVARNNMVTEN